MIEHVADPMEFCKSLAALTKKNGIVFISTLNRSIQSFGLAIVAAEYVLGWVCFLFLSKSPLNLSITGLTAVTTVADELSYHNLHCCIYHFFSFCILQLVSA